MDNNELVKIKELKSFRELNSQVINERVFIKGLVQEKNSPYFVKVKTSFVCEKCGITIELTPGKITYGQNNSLICPECQSNSIKPSKDKFRYVLIQEIILRDVFQDDNSNRSLLNVKVLLYNDLIDSVSCDEIVKVQGMIKVEQTDLEKNGFLPVILAEEVQTINYLDNFQIIKEEQEAIVELSEKENILEIIAGSIAPAITGFKYIKQSIALQLFGGTIKTFDSGVSGGDINLLIIGDPNTGKTPILINTAMIAPISIYADNNKYKLPKSIISSEENIMDNSKSKMEILKLEKLLCIDHLSIKNKETPSVEENYTKNHILHLLNSSCPVLAAANPKYDRFNRFETLSAQVDLSHSVLSEFDLVFLVEDKPDYEKDREIAHKYLQLQRKEEIEYLINPELLKKYVIYAKRKYKPIITAETSSIIEDLYLRLRHSFVDGLSDEEIFMNITQRHLSTLVKFAEASAKIRLSNTVNSIDVHRGFNIIKNCFKELGFETGRIQLDQWLKT